ncbi:zinc finger protein ZFP2-like isoform X2 [Cydia pomonella]|nr:zinc finger protein ZFP2-like isoform X2 [Cydia pomonella]XP_061715542.1 zinc finger protein ZFP2-like isoform X2 [Cydia pomonella]XP_061715543.1 zinc finger protein ZFP2-like isoform X2 [Cydia pomonella]
MKKTMRLEEVEELKFLSHEERIQYLVKNAHLIKDEIFNDAALKKNKLKKEALVRKPRAKNDKLISKTGKLKNRNKNIKYMDSILMSELLIKQAPRAKKKNSGDNNNDNDLSDQNNSDCSKRNPNASESVESTQNNGEIIEITIDTDKAINLTEVAQINVKNGHKISTKKKQSMSKNQNTDMVEICIDTSNPVIPQGPANDEKKATGKRKKTILAERLERMKTVKLSNGVSLSMEYYQCDHCRTKFCTKSSLQRHMLMHLNLKPYACPDCPNRHFRQRGNWRAHIRRRHPQLFINIKYECLVCRKPFVSLEDLKCHKKEHVNMKKKRYTCVFCEKVFKEKSLLADHEKHHMAPGRYKCSMCSMSYDSRVLYSDHLKTHAKVDDKFHYSCQYCGKSYLRPSSIARHIRVSHGGMRMQCPICNKLLKGHLTEHMRTHENERPHECDVCGQKFTQSTQLTVHKRSHTGARPYPCRICKQPFSHSNALMLHIRRHTGEKPFACAMCPQTFSQLPHMKAHMRSIHSKTEFYKCAKCNTFFKLKALLEAHVEECGAVESLKKPENSMLVSKMRFHLALLFTMIASKEKLNDLGFNKRLIDDILVDSIEAMGLAPCKDKTMPPYSRLKINALMLLQGTVPKPQMALFVKEEKTTEEILELLTDVMN